jgi:hypothetical protein
MSEEHVGADIKRVFARYHLEPMPLHDLARVAAAGAAAKPERARRRGFLTRRRALGGLSIASILVATLVAGAYSLGLGPSSRPPSAWAGWQPVPTKPDLRMRAVAQEKCRPADPSETIPGSSLRFDQLPLVIQDQRGDAALFIYGDGTTFADCELWHDGDAWTVSGLGSMAWQAHPMPGTVEVLGGAYGSVGPQQSPFSFVVGRTSAARVEILRSDGMLIEATVQDGAFAAWWPSGDDLIQVIACDGDRVVGNQTFPPFPSASPPDPNVPPAGADSSAP